MLKFVSIVLGFVSVSVCFVQIASARPFGESSGETSYSESFFHQSYGGTYMRASYYSSGRRTASGERFNPNGYTAASRTLPFGTRLRVTNPSTGRSVVVRINDRGPFIRGRSLDLARGAAAAIGMIGQGTANLKVARLN